MSAIAVCLFLIHGCEKEQQNTLPSKLTTYTPYVISGHSAICGGELLASSADDATDFGLCWGISSHPTLDGESRSMRYTCSYVDDYVYYTYCVDGLQPGFKYYVRAYMVQEDGTCVYGENLSFTTGSTEEGEYYKTFEVNGVSFRMVLVSGGSFDMGSQSTSPEEINYDPDAHRFESPVHHVTLHSYYIGEMVVTQELWQAVMGSNPSAFPHLSQRPVEEVSWTDITNVFLPRLNYFTGGKFRLPTEAEWEFAARGINQGRHFRFSGNDDIDRVGWYEDNSGHQTHVVGQLEPNERGLYDMSGNVYEWCADWFSFYKKGSQTNPEGEYNENNPYRIIRGGSESHASVPYCRCTFREAIAPDDSYSNVGFRLACNL